MPEESVHSILVEQSEGHPSVRVYSGPNGQSRIIGEIASGAWAQGSGELRGLFVSIFHPFEGWIGEKNVRCIGGYLLMSQADGFSSVRVFAKPREDADQVGAIPSGEWAACMGEYGDFARVSLDSRTASLASIPSVVTGWVGWKHVLRRSLEVPAESHPLGLEPSGPAQHAARPAKRPVQPAAKKKKKRAPGQVVIGGIVDAADEDDSENSLDGVVPESRPQRKRKAARRAADAISRVLTRIVPTKSQRWAPRADSDNQAHHRGGRRVSLAFGFGHVLSRVLQLNREQADTGPIPERERRQGRRMKPSSWEQDDEIDWPAILEFRMKALFCIVVQQSFVSGIGLLIDLAPMIPDSSWEAQSHRWKESASTANSNYGSSALAMISSALLLCLLLLLCGRYSYPLGPLLCAAYTITLTLACGFFRGLSMIAGGYSAGDYCPWHLTLATFPVPLVLLSIVGCFRIPLIAAGLGVVVVWNASLSVVLFYTSCATSPLLVPVLICANLTNAYNVLWISAIVVWLGQEDDYFQPMFVGGGIAGSLFGAIAPFYFVFLLCDYTFCYQ